MRGKSNPHCDLWFRTLSFVECFFLIEIVICFLYFFFFHNVLLVCILHPLTGTSLILVLLSWSVETDLDGSKQSLKRPLNEQRVFFLHYISLFGGIQLEQACHVS